MHHTLINVYLFILREKDARTTCMNVMITVRKLTEIVREVDGSKPTDGAVIFNLANDLNQRATICAFLQ